MALKTFLSNPPMDDNLDFAWQDWFKELYFAVTKFKTKAGAPTVKEIPPGCFVMYKDITGGTLKLYANDGGTIKSVALV